MHIQYRHSMKILYPMIFFLAVLPYLISHQAYSIPYIAPQEEYVNSDIVVIGKVISAVPFSSTYTKYQIQVEQYLKNPHNQDVITVIAEGTNKTMVEQGRGPDTVYDVGQRVLLYLKNENGNYVAWYFSHSTDSLCDPAPTKDDLNFSLPKDARFSTLPAYSLLRVETGIPNLFRVDDTMLIHYDTWNRHFTTKTFDVEFDVKNGTNGELLSSVTKQVELKPCIGHQTVDTSFIPKKAGTYEIDVIFDNSLLGTTVVVEHNVSSVKLEKTPLSPMQQFKEGIKPEYVKCNQNLHLIIKTEDGSFACVTIETGKNLAERGWATTFGTGISTNDYYTKCDTLYPQSDTGIAVLYMPTNSIGKICVKYSNPNNTPVPIVGGIRIFDPNNSYLNATGITTWIGSTNSMIPKGDSTMVYWVKTGNQTGFYGLRFVCGATPFAVGYDNNSKIVSSDFSFVGVAHSCPVMLYDVKIEGLSGIGVKYIPFP